MVNYSEAKMSRVFGVLADPTRRQIVSLLGHGPQTVTGIAANFTMSLPAVSKHLRIMEEAGVVSRHKQGRIHEMSLRPEPLEMGIEWLQWHQRFWKSSLKSLKTYLEGQKKTRKSEEE